MHFSPARQQKGKQAGEGEGDDDDYDYDDPFLDDGSSDDYAPTDESSDSAPEPSQDMDEEDTRRMMKEAKKFVKKRR
ncbi:hypothetical protein E2C01_074956 [Portunus trituberculatus]|uniref:Uncharacterized protein n=1 Tax=Portunus trituberculatus TaxID=210409 RepID=A0A5B7IHU6_PORTR|nr:hypothetical protein [Portunus trituberculatus]